MFKSVSSVVFSLILSLLLVTSCTMPQDNSQAYKNQIPASVGPEHIVMTKHNLFVRPSDRICVIKAYDERNGNILYRQSGAYIQKITYDKFAQHSHATFLLQSYDEQTARAEINARSCNILVHPQILHWDQRAFESQNIVVKLHMYECPGLRLVNAVTLTGSAIRQGGQFQSGLSTIDHAFEQYINWLYKN